MRHLVRASALVLASSLVAVAQDKPHVFVGARVIPIAGPEMPNGVVVIDRGKILAVGPPDATKVPAGAIRHDLSGKFLMPGLVDTHSHIGDAEGADASAPIQPDVRVVDAINLRDAGLQKAQAGGMTTVNIMPGSGHLLSGQTLYVKLRDGKSSIEELVVADANGMTGGMKMANGTNSRRKDPIKKAGIPVIVHPTMYRSVGELENLSMETASVLKRAGIPIAIESGFEAYVPKTRVVLFEAALAAANGLSFDEALGAIAIDAARLLRIEKRVGSLEPGKDGDLALYDGDPFEYASHCTGVVIQGEVVSETVN
jgi:imidazolonepropionase-like amidohydrolase